MAGMVLYTLLSCIPMGLVLALLKLRESREKHEGRRVPVPDKLLRPPGESARRKAEFLDNRLTDELLWLMGFPVLLILMYSTVRQSFGTEHSLAWHFTLAVILIAYTVLAMRLVRIRRDRDQWRLGYRGERAVGQILDKLMLDGCRVYHDYPLSKNWNLDHVVVAPSGVYAVETKTRTKRKPSGPQPAHEVIYDGICLQFPNAYDSKSPAQAGAEAEELSLILSQDLRETIKVKAILTLPGWWVTCKGEGEVMVLNPKMIQSEIVKDEPPVLSPELIKEITRHLDRKCRDVEF